MALKIAKCNMCGFVDKYRKEPAKIKCKACGSNESLSVREGKDVLQAIRKTIHLGSAGLFNIWKEVA